jgi:hypothetical protein
MSNELVETTGRNAPCHPIRPVLLIISVIGVLGLIAADVWWFERPFLDEDAPEFHGITLLRTFAIAVTAWLFVAAFRMSRNGFSAGAEQWNNWGVLSLAQPQCRCPRSASVKSVIVATIILLGIFLLMVFFRDKKTFTSAVAEGIIEELSAILCLLAALAFAVVTLKLARKRGPDKGVKMLGAALFAGIFFVIGMEEVSWLQRLLDIETPEILGANRQGELNLHNLATNHVENAYYLGTFVFLVVLPFLDDTISITRRLGPIGNFIPSRFVLFSSAIAVAYNYDMWNVLLTQLAFFISFFILISYSRDSADRELKRLARAVLAVYCVTQLVFLAGGDRMLRDWDATEYKEFFIPLAFLLYAIETAPKLLGDEDATGSPSSR